MPRWWKPEYLLAAVLTGILLVILGILFLKIGVKPPEEELIIEKSGEISGGEVIVDVGGSVQKPGVYHLPADSRVNDALVIAGGLSQTADREWVEKTLNLAQKLTDGQKIYIVSVSEKVAPSLRESATLTTALINVNTASIAELDTLWGIGEATAKKIIDNRPYSAIEDLLNKKVIKSNVYETIKTKISVY